MTHPPIPLAEQIAAVERAHMEADFRWRHGAKSKHKGEMLAWRDALAAALATLRGLLLIEETR